jgi:hypothetical protein
MLGAQLGVDLSLISHGIANSARAIIGVVLNLTGNG